MRWHALRGCWQLNSASPSWTLKSAKLGLLFNNCLFALFSLYCVKWCGLSSLVTNKTNILKKFSFYYNMSVPHIMFICQLYLQASTKMHKVNLSFDLAYKYFRTLFGYINRQKMHLCSNNFKLFFHLFHVLSELR